MFINLIPEMDEKEGAKTEKGNFHGYDNHVQVVLILICK